MKDIKCGMCEEFVGARVKTVICKVCDILYHIKCAKINDELYDRMKECKTTNWACDKCIDIKTKNHKKEVGNEKELMIRMSYLMQKMDENEKREQEERKDFMRMMRKMEENMHKMEENAKREQEERKDFMRLMRKIDDNAQKEQDERKKIREQFKIIIEQNKLLVKRLDNMESDMEEKIEQKVTHRVEYLLQEVKGQIEERLERQRREDNVVILGMEEGDDFKKIKLLMKELEINVKDDSYSLSRIGK